MFRVAAVLASFAGVSAFAPAGRMASSSALKMGFESEAGVTLPLGFFDPLKLAKADNFDHYRASELKNGRVAQLAVLGYVVPEIARFPVDIAPGIPCTSVPNGIAAIEAIPALGWMQMFFLIGAVDYYGYLTLGKGVFKEATASDATPEELKELTNKELNNGRLAMLAILELLRHDAQKLVGGMYAGDHLITGLPFLYQ